MDYGFKKLGVLLIHNAIDNIFIVKLYARECRIVCELSEGNGGNVFINARTE